MKTLLIIGAGVEQVPAIQIAKKMGISVVASDMNPQAPGFKYTDDCIIASTMDAKESLRAALAFNKKHKIDGVIAIATDCPMTVALIADKLKLPGISIDTARLASNKLLMKNKFKKDSIPIPWYKEIRSLKDLKDTVRSKGYLLVIKPVDSRGARGVLRLTEGIDLKWAYMSSKKESPSKRVMVEEFLDGPQLSTESIIYKGKAFTIGYGDRNYEFLDRFSPYIIENGGEMPANISNEKREQINALIERTARSIGIRTGTIKGDIVLTCDGPKIIEVAARLSGGYYCSNTIPLSTGINVLKYAIKLVLGEPINVKELRPKYNRGTAQRFFFPEEGTVKRISGIKKVKSHPYIKKIGVYAKIGDRIHKMTDHTKRAGFLLAIGRTREEALKRALEAVNSIKIETE